MMDYDGLWWTIVDNGAGKTTREPKRMGDFATSEGSHIPPPVDVVSHRGFP
jgi:hypothetical protein